MPTIAHDNEIILRCACGSRLGHVAYLVYEPAQDPFPEEWYLCVSLDPGYFWRRLWLALKYVWRPRWYVGYSEIILTSEDAKKLAGFIRDRLK